MAVLFCLIFFVLLGFDNRKQNGCTHQRHLYDPENSGTGARSCCLLRPVPKQTTPCRWYAFIMCFKVTQRTRSCSAKVIASLINVSKYTLTIPRTSSKTRQLRHIKPARAAKPQIVRLESPCILSRNTFRCLMHFGLSAVLFVCISFFVPSPL